ncbi:MAG: DUF302 domain-containing protein [Calditrichaeota bacterium]|nr:MAG: DUF302 domain-containing protein [Calditrichota bacterium]
MTYHFSKKIDVTFEEALTKVEDALKIEGFGILTQIDVKATFKNKLDVDFRKYKILGACNPNFAIQAISAEAKVGTLMPCNVIVQETEDGKVEVSAINPRVTVGAIGNKNLDSLVDDVTNIMKKVVSNL